MRFGDGDSTSEIYIAFGLTALEIKNSRANSRSAKNEPTLPVKINSSELYSSLQQSAETVVLNARRRR